MRRISLYEMLLKEDDQKLNSDLQKSLKEYERLSKAIEQIDIELKPLSDKKKQQNKQLKVVLKTIQKQMNDHKIEQIKVSKWIISLKSVLKYKNITPNYKQLWLSALDKLNGATRRILQMLLQTHKESKRVQRKIELEINLDQGIMDILKGFLTKLKSLFNRFKDYKKIARSLPKIKI